MGCTITLPLLMASKTATSACLLGELADSGAEDCDEEDMFVGARRR